MDSRLLLVGAGVVGAILGVVVMMPAMATTPPAPERVAPRPVLPIAAPVAPVPGAPVGVTPSKGTPVDPAAGLDPDSPEAIRRRLLRNAIDDEYARRPKEEAPVIRTLPPGQGPPAPREEDGLRPDYVGVQMLFTQREDALAKCLTWNLPDGVPMSWLARVQLHIEPVDGVGKVTAIKAAFDEADYLRKVVPCVRTELADVTFQAPPEPVDVTYPLPRK